MSVLKGSLRIGLSVAGIAAAVVLGGCGNAYEKITMGNWVEVGRSEAPAPLRAEPYIVETTHRGGDRAVHAGDLVKARLQVATAGADSAPVDVWVWLGREPVLPAGATRPTTASYGQLGSARFRGALIGRRLNEKFRLRGVADPTVTDQVPMRGLITGALTYHRLAEVIVNGKVMSSPEGPAIELSAPKDVAQVVAQVEILQICAAKLYRRTATLRQWGVWFGWAEPSRHVRKGELGWSLIDAQCPSPDGHLKLQAGPFYDPYYNYHDDSGGSGELLNWSGSYVNLRPPSLFPEEWTAGPWPQRASRGTK